MSLTRAELWRRIKRSLRIMLFGDDIRQRLLTPLSESELEQIQSIFPQPKFFIFGHARSGTTLLARLLRVHPEVHCNWQAHFFTRPPFINSLVRDAAVEEWLGRRSNRWNQGKDYSTVLLRSACDFMLERESRALGKKIVGDKSPNNLEHGEAVKRMYSIYPDGSMIFVVRDGRDAVLSHVLQDFLDHPDRLSATERRVRRAFLRNPDSYFKRECSLFTPATLRMRAQEWVTNVHETIEFGQQYYGYRFHSLRFEDLVTRPYQEIETIWNFLGASLATDEILSTLGDELNIKPDEQRRLKQLPPLVNLKRKGNMGTWKELFTDRDVAIFHEIAGETLLTHGYTLDGG
jgi:hypothetical protein